MTEATNTRLALSAREMRCLGVLAEALYPETPEGPGALALGAPHYIDRALAGAYRTQLALYQAGLAALDRLAKAQQRAAFDDLPEARRNEIVAAHDGVLRGRLPSDDPDRALLERFVAVARQHVIEGVFADPAYGGNRAMGGWRAIGFPGAQWGYGAEAQTRGFDATVLAPKSLADVDPEAQR